MANSRIIPLRDSDDVGLVGGKASALNHLIIAGSTVPPGFVLPTTLSESSLTAEVERQILDHFDALNVPFVAVRSSAVGEDGADAAWAGQLDSFLNTPRDKLISNIKKCWQSANSERAKSYAQQRSLQTTTPAVIVQAMVQSEVSGVAFSVHPVTQNRSQCVIEAGLGLGEAVVSGQITPDTYVIDKTSGQILEKHVSAQTKQLKQAPDGSSEWAELGGKGEQQKLADTEIMELAGQVQALETRFGFPVDIEWARAHGTLYTLQSRPITTLT